MHARTLLTALVAAGVSLAGTQGEAQDASAAEQKPKASPSPKPPRKPAPSYTDEDLKRSRESGKGNLVILPPLPPDAAPAAPAEPSAIGGRGDGEKGGDGIGEADSWRQRAQSHREAVAAAAERVKQIESRLGELTNDMSANPGDLFDPSRMQKREAEKQKLVPELEEAKTALAAARQALAEFEQEARSKNVPPGWLEPRS
jgi:hypothetical protein